MVTLRAQQEADTPLLVALAQRSWKDVEASVDGALGSPLDRLATPSWEDHHEAVVRAACQSPESSVVVAEDDGEVVGLVSYRVHAASAGMSEYGEVEVIAVDPACRGRGVGRALLDHAVRELRDAGVPVIMLETGGDEGHTPARALYESAGFRRLPTAQYWLPGSTG
jgi:ribosomal protein S18 acetylase RimI-like enzyme